MTKPFKLSVAFLLTVCQCVCAQEIRQLSIREMFSIADARNADIGAEEAKIAAARQGEDVARNALLPQINASLTLSYLGDGTILDRDFGNTTPDRLPHFSNTLGVELYQPVYTGGAISSAIKLAATPGSGREWFYEYFTRQNLMLAVKECFGYLVLLGGIMMLAILFARFSPPMGRLLPRMGAAARWIRNPHSTPDPTLH